MSGSPTNFVFVTPAYNCNRSIVQTCMSMIAQSYTNWRAIIYDDMSTDNTPDVVDSLTAKLGVKDRIQVISRKEKYGEVRNTIDAMKDIDDNEVVCRLDGGDWLTDLDALVILDQIYRSRDPAVLWTKHRWEYTSKNISGPLAPDIDAYKYPWVTSHLKTFRKKSINDINHKNFKDEDGNWIMIACDQAVFLPILHKAKIEDRPRLFLPHVFYHYSIDLQNPDLFTCDRSIRQKQSAELIRARGYIE